VLLNTDYSQRNGAAGRPSTAPVKGTSVVPAGGISLSAVEPLGDALRDVRPIAVNVDVVSSCDERPRDVAEQDLTLRVDPLRGL
jgi:hypothetical protein